MSDQSRRYTHLVKDLDAPCSGPIWPPGARVNSFAAAERAEAAHGLLDLVYRESGGGEVQGFAEWWAQVRNDADYDPFVFFFVTDETDRIIAVAHCWRDGFIKDLAVDRPWRRKGLGTALLLHVFGCLRARGARCVELKVLDDNPSGAARLYRRLDMRPVT